MKELKLVLQNNFIKFAVIPLFISNFLFIIFYFYNNFYMNKNASDILLENAKYNFSETIRYVAQDIENTLQDIEQTAIFLQKEHQELFESSNLNKQLKKTNIKFDIAKNGVFYKTTRDGSSLYYSANTKLTKKEKNKAIITEKMDKTFKSIVDTNKKIVAVYFNSFDGMNRIYPFIDDVYKQFNKTMKMQDFNFYYLADSKHNPLRKPVWTDTYIDPAGNGLMLSCIVPIYNNDNFLEGVTGIDITIENFIKHILNKPLPNEAKLLILNKNNDILVKEKNIKPKSMLDNKKYLTFTYPIDITNWKLVIIVKKNNILEITKKLQEGTKHLIFLDFIVMLLILVMMYFYLKKNSLRIAKKIANPINQLTKQTIILANSPNAEYKFINTKIYEIDKLSDNFHIMIEKIRQGEEKLIEINNTLELKISQEVAKNRIKDQQLLENSKKLQMAEMIKMIAHQWRQPLNAISATSINLSLLSTMGVLENEKLQSDNNFIQKQCQNMSNTIDTFMNFTNTQKISTKFYISNILDSSLQVIGTQLKDYGIEIQIDIQEDKTFINGYEDLVKQLFINILSNARDAFYDNKIQSDNKIIKITVISNEILHLVRIEDNAGGIKEKIKCQIFNPYFTTKEQGKGIGMGLFICSEIMQKNFNGKIIHKNTENGSLFELIFGENK